jgi:hypothetical protein
MTMKLFAVIDCMFTIEVIHNHSGMEQIIVKFIADQAKSVYRYRNTKTNKLFAVIDCMFPTEVMTMKTAVFFNVTLCSAIQVYQCLRGSR